jgi:low temperature requirement protein LtrA
MAGSAPPETTGARATARVLGAGGTFRLEPPRLRTTDDPSEERHATWFELFFDLVFAAAVSQLAASLARQPDGATFARFAALFVLVVWPWVIYTLYSNRFDTDDLIFRLAKSGAMFAIAAVAVTVPHVMEGRGGTVGFALGCVALRALLIALYVRAIRHVSGPARKLSQIYTVGYSATTCLWLASVFVRSPAREVLWGIAMVTELIVPTRGWAILKGRLVDVSHLTERFGTFFIIVLGQTVVSVVTGVAGFEFTFSSWVMAAICLLVGLCLWWIYFDLADTSVVGRGVLGLVYVYAHFPLLAGVSAFGVGTKLAITEATHPQLAPGTRWALAAGVGAFALALAIIHIGAAWTSIRDRTFLSRNLLVVLAVGLAAGGGGLPPFWFVGVLALAVMGQLMLEAFTPRQGAASILEPPEPAAPQPGLDPAPS